MKWVEETEVLGSDEVMEAAETPETCIFCHKIFDSHHKLTAHLRAHGDDLNNHILNIITSATKPMSVDDIQALSGLSVSVRNSIYRLANQNKIRRVQRGKFVPSSGVASTKKPASSAEASSVLSGVPGEEWNSLIVTQLQKHPEIYQRIVNEVILGIRNYLDHSSRA